jgi:hypothetical protein
MQRELEEFATEAGKSDSQVDNIELLKLMLMKIKARVQDEMEK